MEVLVLNAGSSSLKFAIIDSQTGSRRMTGIAERLGTTDAAICIGGDIAPVPEGSLPAALRQALESAHGQFAAIGHRVVHGGSTFTQAARINGAVMNAITACVRFAPLHNPANLAGIAATQELFPEIPQVAVFDTAFHQAMPEVAYRYAVPSAWYHDLGVRRYGFHGTSHRFVAQRAAELLRQPLNKLRLITAHLGNGCSACAIRDGVSVDTTMGLTPLEGLVMGTRSGDLDPGIIPYLMQSTGCSAQQIIDDLNRRSGLLGLSDRSNDMRTLSAAAASGDAPATLAIAVFCYRLAKSIAALAVPLGRLDALIFTGGIGEHSVEVRSNTLALLGILGFSEDPGANAQHGGLTHGRITTRGTALVIPTDEELMIARDTADLLSPPH